MGLFAFHFLQALGGGSGADSKVEGTVDDDLLGVGGGSDGVRAVMDEAFAHLRKFVA